MVDNDASGAQRPEPLTEAERAEQQRQIDAIIANEPRFQDNPPPLTEEEIERWLVEFDPTSANIRRLIADLRASRAEVERLQSLQDCKRCGDWNE